MMITVALRSVWIGKKTGYVWDVLLDGKEIVHHSDDPEHDAARALKAMGMEGPFQTTRNGVVAMRYKDIAYTATRRTGETKLWGPQEGPWKPFSRHAVEPLTATED